MIARASHVGCVLLTLLASPLAGQGPLQLVREIRIGELDGEAALTDPGSIAIGRNGIVVVSQPKEGVVRLFSSRGEPLRVIGRRGSGPGEFRSMIGIGIRADSIWVSDPRQRRFSVFSLEGDLLDEISWPRFPHTPLQPVANGSYAVVTTGQNGVLPFNPQLPWPVITIDESGARMDTVAFVDVSSKQFTIAGQQLISPIADGALSGYTPDGRQLILVDRRIPGNGRSGQFTVTWIDIASSDTTAKSSFPYRPVPMSRDAVGQLTRQYVASGAPPERVQEVRRVLEAQAFLPPISALVVGDSEVWLAREAFGRATVQWERYNASQGLIGHIELPWRSRLVAAGGNRIWVVERDELDVPYVTRYRVSK